MCYIALVAATLLLSARLFPDADLRHGACRLAGADHRLDAAFADRRFAGAVGRAPLRLQLHRDAHMGLDLLSSAPMPRAASFCTGPALHAVPVIIFVSLAAALVAGLLAPRLGRPRRASPLSATEIQHAAPSLFNPLLPLFHRSASASSPPATASSTASSRSTGSRSASASSVIGLLWAWGVVAEVCMFLFFNRFSARSRSSR